MSVKQENTNTNDVLHFMENDIVIAGISGRFPQSSNIEEFKQNLIDGMNMVTDVGSRWPVGIYGLPERIGKINNLSNFDASYFGVHPKQANVMDPQLRMLLEVTYEAIVDAGINPSTLKGSKTGVFVTGSYSDANNFYLKDPETVNGYSFLGCTPSMFANRISFTFDFTGPSYALDTGCSSAIFALHQAVTAIRSGSCDAAIVGGLNLVLDPVNTFNLHKLGILSSDGKCKVFDATADGYTRADAVVAIYLQKAKNAHRVYTTVVHTQACTDGYKLEGITYPSSDIQYQFLNKTYNEAGINPKDVVYVEAHGTGTKIGDRQEVNSLDKMFCKDRETPLLIGSVKSNMGHGEHACGLCSIAKVLLTMEMGIIPANLHFNIPNPNIPSLIEGRIRVVDKTTPWDGGLVGINSFGFGGVNTHVILRSNPKTKLSSVSCNTKSLPKLVSVSGRTKEAVSTLLDKAKEHWKDDEFLSLLHIIYSNDTPGHKIRGYEILTSNGSREVTKMTAHDEKRPIWFVFSGMGVQWSGMGRELLGIEIFKCSLQRCAKVLKSKDIDLMNIITSSTNETFENLINSFVSITSIQVAFVDLLTSMGIHPDGMVGFSLGELACAYADGAFTMEQTVLAAYYRGKSVVDSESKPGAMAAIGLNWKEVENICPPDVFVACHNSADVTTISGPVESVQMFLNELKKKDIFVTLINCCGFAFHSIYIASAQSTMRAALDEIVPNPKQRSTRWVSSSVSEAAWNTPLALYSSSEYFVNNFLSPVLFHEAIMRIPQNAITIEIASHCSLQAILRTSLPPTVTNISLCKRNHPDNLIFLLSNLGKLYIAGAQPNISKLYPPINFPVSRKTPMIGSLIKWDHSVTWKIPTYKETFRRTDECAVEIDLSKEADAYLAGYRIDSQILLPDTGYIVLVWKMFAKLHNINFEQLPVIFENVRFYQITIMPEKGAIKFIINIYEKECKFEVCVAGVVAVSGYIRICKDLRYRDRQLLTSAAKEDELSLNSEDIYKEFKLRGHDYRDMFKGIKFCDSDLNTGKLSWFNEWIPYIDTMFQFNMLSKQKRLHLPSYLQYVKINPLLHKQLIEQLPKREALPVYHYKNVNIVKSGGIELGGLKFISIPRPDQSQINPKYERYTFVPYENSYSLEREPLRSKMHALTILLQIMVENVTGLKIKILEIVGKRSAEELLAPYVIDVIYGEPMLTANLQIVTVSSDNYKVNLKQTNVNVDIITKDTNNVPPGEDMHLVVAADLLSNQSYNVLNNIAAAIKADGFILLEESTSQFDYQVLLKKTGLLLAGIQTDSTGKSYILLKKQKEKIKSIIIEITNENLLWLKNVKTALKESCDKNQEVLIVSQNEETSGIVGFMNCIRPEISDIRVRYFFIQDKDVPKFSLSVPFYADQLDKGLMANVLKGGKWGCYRHLQLDQESLTLQIQHAYMNAMVRENSINLQWIESPLNHCQPHNFPKTLLCDVYYASLSLSNITLINEKSASGAFPRKDVIEDPILGHQFSGRDANGHRVMGIVKTKKLTTTLLADPDFLWEVPDKWTLQEAATIPIAYAISYYALFVRGQLKSGESVLIHAGTSDIGQAAISIATNADCTVFTTVETLDQKQYLKHIFPQLNDKYIGNFQDTEFEEVILTKTQERGVDIILNSLANERLQDNTRFLAINGRFLELCKYHSANDNYANRLEFLKNATLHSILLEVLFENHAEKRDVIRLISEGIENGAVQPLSLTVFATKQIEEGLKFLATGRHDDKILLKFRNEESRKCVRPIPRTMLVTPRAYMHSNKSYVIVGGLGGVGFELAHWLITRGAKLIVLASRSGIHTGYQALCIRRWRNNGVNVIVSTNNATTLSGAERLIKESNQLAPIGGIFNVAAVLRDALIENLKETDYEMVTAPKVDITRNLDVISRKSCFLLDYFVVFSSISSSRGIIGQCNYGYANSAMESIVEQRHADGLPGLAIQWGPIADVGIAKDLLNDYDLNGTLPQPIRSCFATMDIFLRQPYPVLSSVIIAEKQNTASCSNDINFIQTVADILGIEDINSVNPNDSLSSLGMDSLMNTEIKQILERKYDIVISPQAIYNLTFANCKIKKCNAKFILS